MDQEVSIFSSKTALDEAQQMAKVLMACDFIPAIYKDGAKGMANCLYAREVSNATGLPWIEVMQNLNIVEGQGMWKSKYLIERFAAVGIEPEYEFQERGKKKIAYTVTVWTDGKKSRQEKTVEMADRACRFIARKGEKTTTGPWVSIEMAIQEGWYFRNGSKWQTLTEKMLMFAAAREYNKYYPVVALNSISTEDEAIDWGEPKTTGVDALNDIVAPDKFPDAEEAQVETEEPEEEMI